MAIDVGLWRRSSIAADIRNIADFFGLPPTGQRMVELTGMSSSSLSRALNGQRVRWTGREHLAIVADFVTKARRDLYGKSTNDWTDDDAEAMRRWLTEGAIVLSGRRQQPLRVLSDERLARRALTHLERAT
jgi:hypothetical protein